MAKVTKTQITIRVMNENADKPMAVVVGLIAKANGVTEAVARGAYRWCVNKGVAAGTIESGRSAPVAKAARKSKEVSATKALKDAGLKPQLKARLKVEKAEAKAKFASKSPDEIAKIKEANLARLKEVSAKQKKYNQVARPEGDGVADFDADVARAEVATMLEEDFVAPKFLSKAQVKALV
jgi:hypothetical protein